MPLHIQLPNIETEEPLKRIRDTNQKVPSFTLTMLRVTRLLRTPKIQGSILKNTAIEELKQAIGKAAAVHQYFSPAIQIDKKTVERNTVTTHNNKVYSLLPTGEYEILRLACTEYSSAGIIEKLFYETGQRMF